MKNLLTFFTFILLASVIGAQTYVVEDFNAVQDSSHWTYVTSDNSDSNLAFLDYSYVNDPVHEGSMAFRIDYAVQDAESYGGFGKFEQWCPDSNGYYDYSDFDSISIWYNNIIPQDSVERVHLRIHFYDASNSPNGAHTYNANETELYYSFHYILDTIPGWHQIKFPMVRNDDWDGNGFNLTGWSGISGNGELDLDKIKGYGLEFSVSGAGSGDIVTGSIVFDLMELSGVAEKPFLVFNGKGLDSRLAQFTWGQSTLSMIEGGGEDPATNSLRWVQGDEWANGFTGAGWNVDPTVNLGYRWSLDSLKFKMKAEAGTGDIRMQFESGETGARGYDFTPNADGAWHEYALPLRDFVVVDDKFDFDSSSINVFQFMSPGTAVAGKTVEFDYIWTGNPSIDVVAPGAPQGVSGSATTFLNIVSWLDVEGETGETYNVYFSRDPITDVTASGVGTVAVGVVEGEQAVEHLLLAPGSDQVVNYYYAVECVDNFGNVGEAGVSSSAVSNTAQGVTTIHPTAPANFAADGNLADWAGVNATKMYPSDGSGNVVTNTVVTDDADCSVDTYVAIDEDYLYVAFDVEDDVVSADTTFDSYLVDSPDLYIGLYNFLGATHTSLQTGDEPDYHFRFNANKIIIDNLSSVTVMYVANENYYWGEKFPSGYVVEAKIPLEKLAELSGSPKFIPSVGVRVPFDLSVNDNDEPGTSNREGIMTYSPYNEDLSYQDVSRWLYTWIGDEWTSDVEGETELPVSFSLDQNYPNPFNPSTTIRYSLAEASMVELTVYNILGEKVVTLVNELQESGAHVLNFNAHAFTSGVYIYQLKAGSYINTKKMMLIK